MDTAMTRRRALQCMAWAGTGLVWTISGGVPKAAGLLGGPESAAPPADGLHFVQISDSHIGFAKEANPDVTATLRQAIARIDALKQRPRFVVHTGDVSHLSKAEEYDLAQQVLGEMKAGPIHLIPGEHDMLDEQPGTRFRERFAKGTQGDGWYSFDEGGVHFAALVNVAHLKAGGMGSLGPEQLAWLADDLRPLAASTPLVVLAHMPLWTVAPEWGWGTEDSAAALELVRRFGSVTVLNGHIHQVMQKVEGNVAFHTAMSTAFPQPKPGTAASPGPMKVPAGELGRLLGVRTLDIVPGRAQQALADIPLSA